MFVRPVPPRCATSGQAKEKAPASCVHRRDRYHRRQVYGHGLNINDEREQTLKTSCSPMDGFDNHKGIVVLAAATNRPDSSPDRHSHAQSRLLR